MVRTSMGKKVESTVTVRIRKHTYRALCNIAYNPPFRCASIAEFFGLVEQNNQEAISAWQRAVKEGTDK